MNKLWIRLTLAFGFVTVIGIIIAAVLANRQVSSQFRRFVAHDQFLEPALVAELTDYYAEHDRWTGVEAVLEDNWPGPGAHSEARGWGWRGRPVLILADPTGLIIYDRMGRRSSGQLSRAEWAEAVPIQVQNQIVGYLTVDAPPQAELAGPALGFLFQLNRSLLQAALIAGGLGMLLGLIFARGLSAPLAHLAAAARRISQGELDQRVPVSGSEEVADLAQAFNEMAAGLQQAETLRRNLVADIAHELRTPLTIVQGNLQAVLDDVYPLEKAEIASIYDATLMLSRLVDDLRELARAEAGQLSLTLQPTQLATIVEGAVSLFEELAREKKINLVVRLPADLPLVLADPDRVQQVLHNLLANALQYTPEAGVVEIAVADPPPSATFICLTVTDTGPGIAPSDLPYVFNRFWRADRSRSREHGGSGLGLAIAKQLVEAQGGQIGVTSERTPGQGSRFWFTLPVASNL